MGLWQWLFGKSAGKGEPVEPSFVAVELVPGALSARVWVHSFHSGAEVVAAVAADPNVIGYVDKSYVDITVKVVYTVK